MTQTEATPAPVPDDPPDEELAFHLAGGTTDAWNRIAAHLEDDPRWPRRSQQDLARAGLAADQRRRLAELLDAGVAAERQAAVERGVRLVGRRSPGWPKALDVLDQPPLALAVRGRWPAIAGLAIVGARACTPYGRQAAAALAATAARVGVPVHSGLARGVDAAALRAALEVRGWPLAVLGCGLDVVYPPEHHELQDQIARSGTLVSEFALGTPPLAHHFPRRNRILAAISGLVLVVEAGERSGALITARHANELGRDVLVVPGRIDVECARGSNRLLLHGATPVLHPEALLQLLRENVLVETDPPRGSRAESAPSPEPALPEPDATLVAALGDRALGADELALATGLDVRLVRSRLVALQLDGCVRTEDGLRFARPARP